MGEGSGPPSLLEFQCKLSELTVSIRSEIVSLRGAEHAVKALQLVNFPLKTDYPATAHQGTVRVRLAERAFVCIDQAKPIVRVYVHCYGKYLWRTH